MASTTPSTSAASLPGLWHFLSALVVVAIEIAIIVAITATLYVLAKGAIRRLSALRSEAEGVSRALETRVRIFLLAGALAVAAGTIAYNGWLLFRGIDVRAHTLMLAGSISAGIWIALLVSLAKLAAVAAALFGVVRVSGILLNHLEAWLNRWDQLRDNDNSLRVLVGGVYRAIVVTSWLLLAVYASRLLMAPEWIVDGLLRIIRAYVVIAVGLVLIRSSVAIVDTLDGLGHRYSQHRGWMRYYDHLRPLVPTFRTSLEYGLWISLAALVLLQFGAHTIAAWGPSLIQAIGLFFVSTVVIELGRLEIGRRLLPPTGLDEMTRRRRETIAPLVRTAFTYAVYFAAAVLILASLGFNPVPFLAGAGILGLVVGFGAQSLINDVVSGFFILFENTYLVGDSIEVADAKGVVEAIDFRTTKIRDSGGRVHIIRNGDVKEVVNNSKDYTMAIVPVEVAYGADLRAVFSVLREAGERLRDESANVSGDTVIDGITAFGRESMTVRTSTRAKPGCHEAAAAELRLAIKDAFDRRADSQDRRGLVPAAFGSRKVLAPRDQAQRTSGGSDARVISVPIHTRRGH